MVFRGIYKFSGPGGFTTTSPWSGSTLAMLLEVRGWSLTRVMRNLSWVAQHTKTKLKSPPGDPPFFSQKSNPPFRNGPISHHTSRDPTPSSAPTPTPTPPSPTPTSSVTPPTAVMLPTTSPTTTAATHHNKQHTTHTKQHTTHTHTHQTHASQHSHQSQLNAD